MESSDIIFEQNPHGLRCYNGNPGVKADGVEQPYTKEELQEYIKCSKDIVYFVETYCKIMTLDYGFTNITLRPYQKKFFKHIEDNRYSIAVWPRQSGKSQTSALYILWKTLFHPDQNWFILANKMDTAREIFGRIIDTYEALPFFLQQGVKKLNESTIEMSNGSKVRAAPTSKSAIRGQSCNGIFCDEAAFVDSDEEFFTSVFPVISSGKTSKIIMASTPNGMNNTFYRTYSDAKKKKGEFKLIEIEWNEVPGRDNSWRKNMIETIGRRKFDQEYMSTFLGSEGALIPLDVVERIEIRDPIYSVDGLNVYEEPIEGHSYLITVDVSRGGGLDYSAFSVIDVTKHPFKQVATYYNSEIQPMVYPHVIYEVGNKYNFAYVLVELNDAGGQVADILAHDLEYMSLLWVGKKGFGGQVLGGGGNSAPGVKTSKPVKTIGCSNLKVMMENGKLEVYDKHTFSEMTSFVLRGNQYEADSGAHDDLMMTLVLFAWCVDQPYFNDLMNQQNRKTIIAEKLAALENDMLPFGFFSDGRENSPDTSGVIDYSAPTAVRDEYSNWLTG